ncbi:hypothetical protein [Haloarchaeobius sp. HME9146]|uniref:hypothetical protein n=1 Tax=Haloarchaeobius sp. HME9146 TaxID=2978732 RepID=UPI0021C00569|nr:hypothetical protein [Haloarchaeobius sp. HME9146]MCT9096933.1 hypothetical protein [Haloarchaeobius sp. HME9146]
MSGIQRREVAFRLFASEFDDATLSHQESDEERAPNYVITPSGARVNRLFVVGVLTEVESVNEEVLRGRIVDPTGAFVVYAGQYQPDEMAALEQAQPPQFVAVTGKARTFSPDDSDRVYTSIRPESINVVDAETRDRWVVGTAEQTLQRVATYAEAAAMDEHGEALTAALEAEGVPAGLANGIPLAMQHYETTPAYLDGLRQTAIEAARVVSGDQDEVSGNALSPGDAGDGTVTWGDLRDTERAAFGMMPGSPASTVEQPEVAESDTEAEATETTEDEAEPATTESETATEAAVESTPDASAASEAEPEPAATDEDAGVADTGEEAEVEAETAVADDTGAEPEPEPAATDEPEPAATDEPEPAATDEPEPAASEEPEPAATDEPEPAATDEPEPAATDEPEPAASEEPEPAATDEPEPAATDEPEPVTSDEPEPEPSTGLETEDDDIGDFEPGNLGGEVDAADEPEPEPAAEETAAASATPEGMYQMDDEEREEIEEEFGAEFSSGTDVPEPGESGIETPEPEPEAEAEADEPAPAGDDEPAGSTDEPVEAEVAADEPEPDAADDADDGDEPAEDVDLDDYVMDVMKELDDGDGADRAELVSQVVSDTGSAEADVEDAIQNALIGGQCYEPDDDTLKPI